ncbi:MAG: group II intron maturase-specific domain-containing protein [Burkholderia sp.]
MRKGRGRSLSHTIEALNPVLRGWINYFHYTQTKGCWRNWTAGYVGACAASCGGKRSTANAELLCCVARGSRRTPHSALSSQQTGSVVECRGERYERGLPETLV